MSKQLDIFEDNKTCLQELKELQKILNKIEKIVNNKDITGIEAKLIIIDILNEMKERNDNK